MWAITISEERWFAAQSRQVPTRPMSASAEDGTARKVSADRASPTTYLPGGMDGAGTQKMTASVEELSDGALARRAVGWVMDHGYLRWGSPGSRPDPAHISLYSIILL